MTDEPDRTDKKKEFAGKSARGCKGALSRMDWLLVVVVLIVCELLVLVFLPDGTQIKWTSPGMRAALAVLVGLPLVLSLVTLCFALVKDPRRWSYKLSILERERSDIPRWDTAVTFVEKSWDYEADRFSLSMARIGPSAILFGEMVTLLLTSAVVVAAWGETLGASAHTSNVFAVSLATAVGAAFLGQFAGILVRIAGQDFNAMMFAWASRLVVLVAIADAGLWILFVKAGAPQWIITYGGAVLLGLFTALLGDRAIDLMLSKTGGVFGVSSPKPAAAASLTNIDGITDKEVDRFNEEGVLTIYDLAFAPTARLFFNTTHSLQRLCDWQDQALLLAYMGPVRTKALFDQLGIRGAIDLQALAVLALAAGNTPEDDLVPVPPATKGKYSQLTAALSKALGPEGAALLALLYTVNTDDVVLRLRVHWKSTAEATQQ